MRPTIQKNRQKKRGRRAGFTIVELLVVIGIIAVLMGLLLPALTGARQRGRKAEEVNRIRQVGMGWGLYSNGNGDGALPGYIASNDGNNGESVQERWHVEGRYKTPAGDEVTNRDAQSWPWRLMPYLDFDQRTIMGHLDLELDSKLAIGDYAIMDERLVGDPLERPTHIAEQPSFGYNAFYVGGWWGADSWTHDPDNNQSYPRPRFHADYKFSIDETERTKIALIVDSPSRVRNSPELILFCSTAQRAVGQYHKVEDQWPGSHFAVPPILRDEEMWRKATSGDTIIEVTSQVPNSPFGPMDVPIPIGRYTEQAAVLFADLHAAAETPGALDDQRKWINAADSRIFMHTEAGPP